MGSGLFVDENDLLLGKRLAAVRDGVVYPGHPDLPEVPRGVADDEWIAAIGARHLVVITRDKKIRKRPVELAAWKANGVRGFVLTGRSSQNTRDSLGILNTHWKKIQQVIDTKPKGPWMYAVTSSGLREIDLS